MVLFPYGPAETDHLCRRDKKLGALIREVGPLERPLSPDPFAALLYSIVNQQISNKAAATVEARFRALVGEVRPEKVCALTVEEIQGCGMSFRKAQYIRGAAEAALNGEVDFDRLCELSDGEAIGALTRLKGVGRWTAEMLLIFSLGRPDVVSFDDLGIRRGMERLYGLKGLTRTDFERYRRRYAPYGTVASFYLWELAGRP